MKHKNNKYYLLAGAIVVVVGYLAYNGDIDLGDVFNFEPEGKKYQLLSHLTNEEGQNELVNLTCYTRAKLHTQWNDGTLTETTFSGSSVKDEVPYTLDIVDRNNPSRIAVNFQPSLWINCNDKWNTINSFGFKYTGSPFSLQTRAYDVDGTEKRFLALSNTFKEVVIKQNVETELLRFAISASSIDNAFTETRSPYLTQILFDITGKIKLDYAYLGGSDPSSWILDIKFGDLPLLANYNVVKILEQEAIATSRTATYFIDSIVQSITGDRLDSGTYKLDTSANQGRQIKVIAVIRDWTESNPTITISKTSVNNAFMTFDSWAIEENKDAKFRYLYTMPIDSPDGEYVVSVKMKDRSQFETKRSFYVENEKTTTITPVDTGGDTGELDSARIRIFYDATYKDGTQKTGFITSGSAFEIALKEFQVTSGLGTTSSSALTSVRITPQVTFEGGSDSCGALDNCDAEKLQSYSTTQSNLQFNTNIIYESGGFNVVHPPRTASGFIPFSSQCITTGTTTSCTNAGLPLGFVEITATEIENAVSTSGNAVVEVDISGNFQLKRSDGKFFNSFDIDGLKFEWDVDVTTTGSGGNGGDNGGNGELPETCGQQGKQGQIFANIEGIQTCIDPDLFHSEPCLEGEMEITVNGENKCLIGKACLDGVNYGVCSGEHYFDDGDVCDGKTLNECASILYINACEANPITGCPGFFEKLGCELDNTCVTEEEIETITICTNGTCVETENEEKTETEETEEEPEVKTKGEPKQSEFTIPICSDIFGSKFCAFAEEFAPDEPDTPSDINDSMFLLAGVIIVIAVAIWIAKRR